MKMQTVDAPGIVSGHPAAHADNSGGESVPARVEWFAVYTRSRHEKAVRNSLQQKVVEGFLPVHDVLSRWKDRRKWVQKPLFPGYLFVHVAPFDLEKVRSTRGVVDIVGDGEVPISVPAEQVEGIRRMIEAPVKVDPLPYMRTGKPVRVKTGPLIGLEGFVVEQKGSCRLVVSIDLLGRSVAAEVDMECVEVLDN